MLVATGTMGIAVLGGVFSSIQEAKNRGETLECPFSRFVTCVRSEASASRITDAFSKYPDTPFEIKRGKNVEAAREADVVLLACKPFVIEDVLGEKGMADALKGKILISILAGVTEERVASVLYDGSPEQSVDESNRCKVVRVITNTAALTREAVTVIGEPKFALGAWKDAIDWVFSQIGSVVTLPPRAMDAATALAGSGPAFAALALEGLADGGVAMGIPRAESQIIATQVLRGTASLIQDGQHPAILREKVSTPGGCTIGGSLVLEEAGTRGQMARAVREATVVTSELGKGTPAVNGTRQ